MDTFLFHDLIEHSGLCFLALHLNSYEDILVDGHMVKQTQPKQYIDTKYR